MYDPMDYIALDDLRLSTGLQISPILPKKKKLWRLFINIMQQPKHLKI